MLEIRSGGVATPAYLAGGGVLGASSGGGVLFGGVATATVARRSLSIPLCIDERCPSRISLHRRDVEISVELLWTPSMTALASLITPPVLIFPLARRRPRHHRRIL